MQAEEQDQLSLACSGRVDSLASHRMSCERANRYSRLVGTESHPRARIPQCPTCYLAIVIGRFWGHRDVLDQDAMGVRKIS